MFIVGHGSLCYEKIYPGCRHQCPESNYRRKKVYHLERLIATPTPSERLASRAVNRCSDDMCLSTLSSRKRAMEAKEPLRKTLFSADDMSIIRTNLNLTSRGTLKLVQDLRMVVGSNRIVCRGEDACHESYIGQFFEHKQLRFTCEIKGKKITENFHQHVIVTNAISSFIDEVMQSRGLDASTTLIRIGLDGGGGFLKICFSLFDLYASESKSTKTLSKKFKDSGVKKKTTMI